MNHPQQSKGVLLNPEDVDRRIGRFTARIYDPIRKKWMETVVKTALLALHGEEWEQNFVVYDPQLLRPHSYPGMPDPAVLPPCVVAELMRGWRIEGDSSVFHCTPFVPPENLDGAPKIDYYLFDLVGRPKDLPFWKSVGTITEWFTSCTDEIPTLEDLSFERAALLSKQWMQAVNEQWAKKVGLGNK